MYSDADNKVTNITMYETSGTNQFSGEENMIGPEIAVNAPIA
jgi:hypothetical protein